MVYAIQSECSRQVSGAAKSVMPRFSTMADHVGFGCLDNDCLAHVLHFLPMLAIFNIDPLFFGILVALNLQTSFLTPPMAMAAYYLKGVAPPHVQLVDIFKGVLPFLSMVVLAMAILYSFPEIALWLPDYLYGKK